MCNPVPNFEDALKECGRSSSDGGSPRVLLWAGASDFVVGGIRKCSQKFEFLLLTVPGSHEHVNIFVAGIEEVRDRLVAFLKPVE